MDNIEGSRTRLTRSVAFTIASSAFSVPLVMSASSSPSPNHPGIMAWYASLRKPGFKPPDWLIPVAWTGIEAGLAAAAYRLLMSPPSSARSKALRLWGWNVFMIGAWSRLFFKRRALGSSVAAAATMVGTGAAFISQARKANAKAAAPAIPFVAWVAFATVLTASIWRLNSMGESSPR